MFCRTPDFIVFLPNMGLEKSLNFLFTHYYCFCNFHILFPLIKPQISVLGNFQLIFNQHDTRIFFNPFFHDFVGFPLCNHIYFTSVSFHCIAHILGTGISSLPLHNFIGIVIDLDVAPTYISFESDVDDANKNMIRLSKQVEIKIVLPPTKINSAVLGPT